jgi:zinc/manganese transport system substrate-binding protein
VSKVIAMEQDRDRSRTSSRRATLLVLIAVAAPARAAEVPPRVEVVASVPALAAVAQELGGTHVRVRSLSRSAQDPHFVDARPSLALELNRADLLLAIGLSLEAGWLPTLVTGSRNPKIQPGNPGYLDCSQFVALKEVQTGPVSRSMGDIHPGGNPHYMIDPRAAAAVARGIADRLIAINPGHETVYRAGLKSFLAKLEGARARWEKRLAPARGVPVIGYHKTWVYLASWVGLVEVDFLEPKPGIPPNPSHVAHLLTVARQRKVRAILQEAYYPDATSKLVAAKIPAALVRVPGGPDFHAGQGYVDYVERVVTLLAGALDLRGGS